MRASTLSRKLEAARKHLDYLDRQSEKANHLPQRRQWLRTLERLSVILAQLRDLVEESCQQNQCLTHAGQALESEHRRYLELFEFAPDGYFVTNAKGIIQEANRAARALLNERRKSLAGKPLRVYVEEEQRPAFCAQFQRLVRGSDERMPRSTYRFRLASGACKDVQLSVAATRTPKGRVTHLRWLMRDITTHKRAEEEINSAHAALERNREELRALAARLLTAQEEERRRVSRELHDDMSQKLALLMVEIETLERNLPLSHLQILEQLRSFRERAARLSDDARNLAYRLHPSILEDLGLAVAMRSHAQDFSARERIRVHLTQKKLPDNLPQEIAACLYRVMQESLRNAAKHAHTQRISVMLTGSSHSIRLSVRDWGVGFDPDNLKVRRSGLGLIGMEERVRLMNGTFDLHSSPGRGSQVVVRLPLPECKQ
jgi:PAS domain S-box-containing protein